VERRKQDPVGIYAVFHPIHPNLESTPIYFLLRANDGGAPMSFVYIYIFYTNIYKIGWNRVENGVDTDR
jgi:hypothetical protein